MPNNGISKLRLKLLAKDIPTNKEPKSPGLAVTLIKSISFNFKPALVIAESATAVMVSNCILEAISGTTPPYFLCKVKEDATTLERIFLQSLTTATAVSSQDVSMPKTYIFILLILKQRRTYSLLFQFLASLLLRPLKC